MKKLQLSRLVCLRQSIWAQIFRGGRCIDDVRVTEDTRLWRDLVQVQTSALTLAAAVAVLPLRRLLAGRLETSELLICEGWRVQQNRQNHRGTRRTVRTWEVWTAPGTPRWSTAAPPAEGHCGSPGGGALQGAGPGSPPGPSGGSGRPRQVLKASEDPLSGLLTGRDKRCLDSPAATSWASQTCLRSEGQRQRSVFYHVNIH